MADNIRLSAGTGDGAYLAAAGLTISGDAAEVQMVGAGILSGSEGSWSHAQLVGGAGVVAAGVQRVTLASDDPAVVDLAAIEVLLTAANVDHAANEVLLGTIDADTGAIKTALEIIDDWDESDRGKVNPIAGQAGIAANAGNMDALTTRVVVATNDTHFGTVGAASDIDGVVHGQLRYIADQLVTIDSDTNNIKTAAELIDDAIYIDDADWTDNTSKHMLVGGVYQSSPHTVTDGDVSPFQVTVNGYALVQLTAGSAAIGKLAANDGVDIGDVDVTSVVPGTAATNLGKARASALGATDTGVAPLAVRNDDLADLAGADGDYTPIQVDANGAVYVNQAAAELKSLSGVAVGGAPGTDDMIAAVAGKKLLIVAMALTATSTTTNNVFVDNADNDLWHNTGNPFPLSTDADGDTSPGIVLGYNPAGWFKTDTVNEAVTLNSSAAQDVAWSISWIETD